MQVRLGNLSVAEIESRLGIEFPEDIREWMKANHQARADNVEPGRWHCFDIPFELVCGNMAVAEKIYESVKDKIHLIKQPMQISINKRAV